MMSAPPESEVQQSSEIPSEPAGTPAIPSQSWQAKFLSPSFFGWFMLIFSLGFHAVILLAPLTGEKKVDSPPPAEKQVRVTKISAATRKKPKSAVKKPASRSRASTIPNIGPAKPKSAETEATDQPPAESEAESATWKDFPRYPQASIGCFNLEDACAETSDALDLVAKFFEKELPARKYTAKSVLSEGDRRAYEVSKGSLLQVLSLLYDKSKGKVYIVLSEKPLTLAELSKASAVPPEVAEILQNLAAEDAAPAQFKDPKLYFDANQSLRSEVMVAQYAADQLFSDMMETFFRTNLTNNEFGVSESPVAAYGDGEVYEVTKGNLKLYINLIPSADDTGTIVVVWKTLPK